MKHTLSLSLRAETLSRMRELVDEVPGASVHMIGLAALEAGLPTLTAEAITDRLRRRGRPQVQTTPVTPASVPSAAATGEDDVEALMQTFLDGDEADRG